MNKQTAVQQGSPLGENCITIIIFRNTTASVKEGFYLGTTSVQQGSSLGTNIFLYNVDSL